MGPASEVSPIRCLVFDLGAGSGRAMLAEFDGNRISLDEIHRFDSAAMEQEDGPHWDLQTLKRQVDEGMYRAKRRVGKIDSIGIDSWGVDYALLDKNGAPLVAPFHGRHERSLRGYANFPLKPQALFEISGAQNLPINTIFQLFDETRQAPERLERADCLLMMADVLNYHLTGLRRSEYTLARTSGLLDVHAMSWSEELCRTLQFPLRLFQPLVRPGEIYGRLRPELAEALGWPSVPVIAVASHDTASATAALPLDDGSGFLVLGSWMLIGFERAEPSVEETVWQAGFGNEGGAAGRTTLIKTLNGLHLIQRLRSAWLSRSKRDVSYEEISRLAAAARPRGRPVSIDPTDPLFFNPPDMVDAIRQFCARRGLALADDLGALALAIYSGLAEEVRRNVGFIEREVGHAAPTLRVCGGGGRDATLCSVIASTLGRPIMVGPIEASAWGNALIQLIALGAVPSLAAGRKLIERSAVFHAHLPEPGAGSRPFEAGA